MDLNIFPYELKNDYYWKSEYIDKIESKGYEIYSFLGTHKLNEEKHILIKNIKISYEYIKDHEIKQIIKEIYLLKVLHNKNYFPKIIDFLISNDNKNIYILFKGNNITLNMLISSRIFDYKKEQNLIKYIIYQLAFGLYILHSNKIIHHNIKPLNILIDQKANISIYNFLSIVNKGEKSIYYTPSYAAPEYYISEQKIDEKYDMWSLGVVMVELYLKKINYFYNKNKEKNETINQLNSILSKFEIEENHKNDDINILMEKILNGEINARFKIEEISNEINDLDAIELIKNLLVINPKERFSAEQVLKSNYLKDYFGFDSLEIEPINTSLDYNENYLNLNDKCKFEKIVDNISKLVKNQ